MRCFAAVLVCLVSQTFSAFAQTAVGLMPVPHIQFLDNRGEPLNVFGLSGVKSLNGIRFADQYSGDWAQRLCAADADLGTTPGVIYVPTSIQGNATHACSLSANRRIIFMPGAFTLTGQSLTVNSGVKFEGTPGATVLAQGSTGTNLIIGPAENDVEISGFTFSGVSGSTPISSNSAIFLSNPNPGNISRANIHDNRFTGWQYHAVYLQNVKDSQVKNNFFSGNTASCIRGSGVVGFNWTGNICRDPATTMFDIGIMTDSTDPLLGVSYPISTDGVIANNTLLNLVDWYAIELHSGQRIVIANNQINNAEGGIIVTPYNGTDTISDLAITGNSAVGQSTQDTACGVTGNYGIAVQSGAGVSATNVTISGNELVNFNAAQRSSTQAGMSIMATNAVVSGNVVKNSYGAGINIFGSGAVVPANVDVSGNQISTVLAATNTGGYCGDGTTAVGLDLLTAGITGFFDLNHIDNAAVSAIRSEVAGNTGFIIGPNNRYTNNAALTSGPNTLAGLGYGSLDLVRTSTPGPITDSVRLWMDTADDRLKMRNDAGSPTDVAGFSDNLGVFASGGNINPSQLQVGSGSTITLQQRIQNASTGNIRARTRTEVLVSWPATMADTNYTVTCSVRDSITAAGTQGLTYERLRTKSATKVGLVISNPTTRAITGSIDCIGEHQ